MGKKNSKNLRPRAWLLASSIGTSVFQCLFSMAFHNSHWLHFQQFRKNDMAFPVAKKYHCGHCVFFILTSHVAGITGLAACFLQGLADAIHGVLLLVCTWLSEPRLLQSPYLKTTDQYNSININYCKLELYIINIIQYSSF